MSEAAGPPGEPPAGEGGRREDRGGTALGSGGTGLEARQAPVAGQTTVKILPDSVSLAREAAARIVRGAGVALADRGSFTLALAGGSTPAGVYRLLAEPEYARQVDWARTLIFFGDERCVPPEHPDSNYLMAWETLLSRVPLPAENVYRIPAELGPEAGSEVYTTALGRAADRLGCPRRDWPRLDLALLGVGEDGHTASLFPGMAALAERRRPVVGTMAPPGVMPAVARVTLTLPVFNAARQVLFLAAGARKAAAVRASLQRQGPVQAPAGQVRAAQVLWLLDREAGAGLGEQA